MTQLVALIVVAPILAALLVMIIGNRKFAEIMTLGAALFSSVVALWILQYVHSNTSVGYAFGGWEAPWGIAYKITPLNGILLATINGVAFLIFCSVRTKLVVEAEGKITAVYGLLLLHLAGLNGILATGDAFNLYVFIEIASLTSYALVAVGKEPNASVASFRYLILGTIGATFILIGISLLYGITGTLNIEDIQLRLEDTAKIRASTTAYAFLITGCCLKLALFPLHTWLPNVYRYGAAPIITLISSISSKIYLYVLMLWIAVFSAADIIGFSMISGVLGTMAVIAIFYGGVMAYHQKQLALILAYSSISQIGFMVLAISLGNKMGYTAALLTFVMHAISSALLFAIVTSIRNTQNKSPTIDSLYGLITKNRWTVITLIIAGCSLVGIPGTIGFVGKWYLIQGVLLLSSMPIKVLLIIAITLGSMLTLLYIFRIIETACHMVDAYPSLKETSMHMAAITILSFLLIIGGIQGERLMPLIEKASMVMIP